MNFKILSSNFKDFVDETHSLFFHAEAQIYQAESMRRKALTFFTPGCKNNPLALL